jgi:hypothetical protein
MIVVKEPEAKEYDNTPIKCRIKQIHLSGVVVPLISPYPTVVMVVTEK